MGDSTLEAELWLPHNVKQVFDFFCNPQNLENITPPWLHFRLLTPLPISMAVGVRIDYSLRVRGVSLRWQSEITVWEPPHRFVDEQRRGPYHVWIHEHRFEPSGRGTLCKDLVRYAPPGGWVIDRLFVRRDVNRIFAFRGPNCWRYLVKYPLILA